jgi:hypothetical protein
LVIRAPKTDTTATSASTSSTTATGTSGTQASANSPNTAQANPGGFPFGLGLPPGMGNLNFANTNFHDMQQQLQQQVNTFVFSLNQQCENHFKTILSIDYE